VINCPENCGDCCGPVPMTEEFLKEHSDKIQRPTLEVVEAGPYLILRTEGLKCVFLTDNGRCAIYNDRPEVCVKFGDETDLLLYCPHFTSDGRKRSRQSKRKLERDLVQIKPARWRMNK